MYELAFLEWLQHLRSPFGDLVFHAASALGSEMAYMAILLAAYLCYSHRFGFHLLTLFVLSVYATAQLKWLFGTQRPFELFPDRIEGLYQSGAGGGGYPSGHAQNAVVVWGLIAHHMRRRDVRIGAVLLIALLCFSRLYLGLHWPADVLGGLLAGAALLLAYLALVGEWAHGRLVVTSRDWALLLVGGVGLMLVFGWHQDVCVRAAGALLGAALGYWLLEGRGYDARGPIGVQAIKLMVALVTLIAVQTLSATVLGHSAPAAVVRYTLAGFVAAYPIPVAFTRCGLAPAVSPRRARA